MKHVSVLFGVALAVLGLAVTAHAAALTAPMISAAVNGSNVDISWTVPAGTPAANKYALEASCVSSAGAVTVNKAKFGTSDFCVKPLLPGDTCPNITAVSLPISFLTLSGAGAGDTCDFKVRGLHNGGPNTDPPHSTGTTTTSVTLP